MGVNKSPYNILRRPVITEKAAVTGSHNNCVVFEVLPEANKTEIKQAVEKAFGVQVESVRVLNTRGKLKQVMRRAGRQRDKKKAYVSLKPGSSIKVIEGL